LVSAREEERRRLRRDLHDGLGPHLASQMLTIDAIGKLLKRDSTQAESFLQDLKHQAQAAISDIRRLVYDLRPPTLDDLGLVAALCEGARHYQQSGLRIDIDAPERLPPLPAAVEVAAYRITQEALTNVVRHAQATTCQVRLGLDDANSNGRGLRLEIQDDGRGLPPQYRTGVGCQAMRERATELGGRFVIESQNGGGTQVSVWLPLLEEDA
jgi:signal transduction histidine kinase